MFRHHPDGIIQVGGLVYPLSEFLLDEPTYALPQGVIAREYVPGDHHFLYDGTSQHAGVFPWAEGDAYIAREPAYAEAHQARLANAGYFVQGADARGWPESDYYEGPRRSLDDISVAKRPSSVHRFDGTAWIYDIERGRAFACADIDRAAMAVDAKYLTVGGQQGHVYQQKLAQAKAYRAAGYRMLADPLLVSDPDYPRYGYVRAYRTALRIENATATDGDAADVIIAQADRVTNVIGMQREEARLTSKAQVRAATSEADINAARDGGIAILQTL